MGSIQSKLKKKLSRFRGAKAKAGSAPTVSAINSEVPGQQTHTTGPSLPSDQGLVNRYVQITFLID